MLTCDISHIHTLIFIIALKPLAVNSVVCGAFRELSPKILAELLIPNPKATNRQFDLTVDQWKFLGHSKSCISSQIIFNIVFVLKVCKYDSNNNEYRYVMHVVYVVML